MVSSRFWSCRVGKPDNFSLLYALHRFIGRYDHSIFFDASSYGHVFRKLGRRVLDKIFVLISVNGMQYEVDLNTDCG